MHNDKKETILIKYGGNAMTDKDLQRAIIKEIKKLTTQNYSLILVHGGGPFIEQFLEFGKIQSEFIQGLRFTSDEAIPYVEAALRGYVNGQLTEMALQNNMKAIGLSAKDGRAVTSQPKKIIINGREKLLGRVGEIAHIDTQLYHYLLDNDYFLILNSIAMNDSGDSYNINADIFAGALAAALKVDHFLVLSNIDGLMEDPEKPESIIHQIDEATLKNSTKIKISEGMMPKMEACFTAVNGGVTNVRIINGQEPGNISKALNNEALGTKIIKS
ncbi:acetylglutamate kinase [Marivirga sp. S37H4]|uniref:Acetylglutamate kinase n=1 Tax=Marivirga aurantiaca TaxID=2802615 RepID=A0A934WWE4_9BACT|nr:acetylglutamate kinase [Marivirga aurantiaca]MBK6264121.1 acetylglutamate kinase [Marivirga aurantiaca]